MAGTFKHYLNRLIMVIGYKKQIPWGKPTDFKRKILVDVKRHTMREDIHNRWHAGRKIQHAHGVRTKYYNQFAENLCTRTQLVYIGKTSTKNEDLCYNYNGVNFGVIVDKKRLTNYQIGYLAFYDGFDTTDDFFHWFQKGFKGKIIHWADLHY